MSTIKPDEISQWLTLVQDYRTSPEALNRIAGSINGVNQALGSKTLSAQPLFWTEPSNLDSSRLFLDFARLVPGMQKTKVHARVIMTPQAVKALHKTLGANIERFEKTHGEIKLAGQPGQDGPGIGFQSV